MTGPIKLVNLKLSPELVHNLLERSHIRIQKLLICDDEKIFSLFQSNAPDYITTRLLESKTMDFLRKDPPDAIVINEKWLLTHFSISLKEILTLKIPLVISTTLIENSNYFLHYQFKDMYVYDQFLEDSKSIDANRDQDSASINKNSLDIRVVNLERRKDRWMNFVSEAKRVGLSSYQQYKAVDGKELKLTKDIETLFEVNPNRPGGKRYTFNHGFNSAVIGCALSHYSLWQQLAENNDKKRNDYMMILEDDVRFDDNFVSKWNTIYTTIEKDDRWDLIFLGFTDDRGDLYNDPKVYENVYKFNQHPSKVRLHGAGMFGYCIRKRAAIKLIELANTLKIQQPIDHFLIDQFDALCAYKTIPYLITTDCHFINPNLDTDIQFCKTVLKKSV